MDLFETKLRSFEDTLDAAASETALRTQGRIAVRHLFEDNRVKELTKKLQQSQREVSLMRKKMMRTVKIASSDQNEAVARALSASRSNDFRKIVKSTMANNRILLRQLVTDKENHADEVRRYEEDIEGWKRAHAKAIAQLEREKEVRKRLRRDAEHLRRLSAKGILSLNWYREKARSREQDEREWRYAIEKAERLEKENKRLRRRNAALAQQLRGSPSRETNQVPRITDDMPRWFSIHSWL